jgi:arylsulfatase
VTDSSKRTGRIVSSEPLPAGQSHIELHVTPDPRSEAPSGSPFERSRVRPGKVVLTVNGKQKEAEFSDIIGSIGSETFDVGSDLGSAVSNDYSSPNRFTGKIEKVTVQLQ